MNKVFLALVLFVSSTSFAGGQSVTLEKGSALTPSEAAMSGAENGNWTVLKSICFSNSDYDQSASTDACSNAMKIVNLLGSDKAVFQVTCRPRTYNDRCTYFTGTVMTTKVLFVGN